MLCKNSKCQTHSGYKEVKAVLSSLLIKGILPRCLPYNAHAVMCSECERDGKYLFFTKAITFKELRCLHTRTAEEILVSEGITRKKILKTECQMERGPWHA